MSTRRVLLLLALVLAASACEARPGPCAGQPDECRDAIEVALERLGPGGRDRVARTEVAPEHDCRLLDPRDRFSGEQLAATWDSRQPAD